MQQNYFRRFLRILIMLAVAGLIILTAVSVWRGFHKEFSSPENTSDSNQSQEQAREQQIQSLNNISAALPTDPDQETVSPDQLRATQIQELNDLQKSATSDPKVK